MYRYDPASIGTRRARPICFSPLSVSQGVSADVQVPIKQKARPRKAGLFLMPRLRHNRFQIAESMGFKGESSPMGMRIRK